MALKTVVYVDPQDRRWFRQLPEGVPDSKAKTGIPIGPPPLDSLGLPLAVQVRLHNQLADRGILTEKDARKNLQDVRSALMAAFDVDVYRILAVYQGQEAEERESA